MSDYRGGRGRGGSDRGGGGYRGGGRGGGGRGGGGFQEIAVHQQQTPPQINPALTALENSMVRTRKPPADGSQDPELMNEGSLPQRPGFGVLGAPVQLWANYFDMSPSKDLVLFRYSVAVAATNDKSNRGPAANTGPVGKKLKRIIELLIDDHLAAHKSDISSDYKTMLISKKELPPWTNPISIVYRAEMEDDAAPTEKIYKVDLLRTNVYAVSDLIEYLTTTQVRNLYNSKEELTTALSVVFGNHPKRSSQVFSVGANKHYPVNSADSAALQEGLIALRGFFVSVRAATGRLLLNVQVKNVACIRPGKLLDTITDYNRGYPLLASAQSTNLNRLARFLRKVRVATSHLKAKQNKAGQDIPRIKTISALATTRDGRDLPHPPQVPKHGAGPADVRFWLDAGGPGQAPPAEKTKSRGPVPARAPPASSGGRYISVRDFFQQQYRITVDPKYPVVNVGNQANPSYLPVEVCTIVGGQPAANKLSPGQTANMINYAVRRPNLNANEIVTAGAALLGLSPQLNATLKQFGISVTPQLITVPGRVLMTPTVRYQGKGSVVPSGGSWNMRDIKFFGGSSVPGWAAVQVSVKGARNSFNGDFPTNMDNFARALATNGLTVPVKAHNIPDITVALPTDNDPVGDFSQLESIFNNAVARKVPLLLFVLGVKDTKLYNRIKYLGDVKYGIHSVCSLGEKFHKNDLQYYANVALKFNLKLGGINQVIDGSKLGIVAEGRTMIVGLDVTHPSPGSADDAPSVAGIVASMDRQLAQWPAAISVQTGRQEMVSGLKDMVKSRLQLWVQKNRSLPENILVYRDGVSEGQYKIVLEQELPLLREACREVYTADQTAAGYPKVSIIVVGKRHHTRFYPTKVADADRNANPKPGTIVDRGITEARQWNFFLQAHAALKGTARPAHYFVVLDEIFSGANRPIQPGQSFATHADTLENLTHNMCYLFGRATKAVSVCPPAYYADLVCERARCYLSGAFDPTTPEASNVSGRSGEAKASFNTEDAKLHHRITNSMFYI